MASLSRTIIDQTSRIPLYLQLADILRQLIEDGVLSAGDIIPTERDLMAKYQVSRTTVREAVTLLVNEGLLTKKQGKGTIVQRPKVSEVLGYLTGFSEEIRSRGMVASAKCLLAEFIKVNKVIADKLQLREDEEVLHIYRLRLANGEPIALEESYWPKIMGNLLMKHDLHDSAYYDILEQEYGVTLSEADEILEASIASFEEAKLLTIQRGDPLLQMERLTKSRTHGIIEFCRTRYRADRYNYHIRLTR